MQRITVTIDDELLETVDRFVEQRGFDSRSEAMREMVRAFVRQQAPEADGAPCVAALSCVYDHSTRDLARRMTDTMHDHHDLTIASLHVHLDHESCLEVSVLRGPASAVRGLADELTGQRGVRHANLHLVPADILVEPHGHGHDHGHEHGGTPHEHIRA